MRARARRLALAALLALPALAAHATCSVSAGNLSFGPYDPLSAAPVTTSGTITVSCNQSPPPTVRIEIGPSAVSGGFFPRRMQRIGAADTLAYDLYVDPGASTVWGDGSAGTATQTQTVRKNQPWTATVYGVVPGGQDVTPGVYADSLAITIVF